MEQGAGSNEPEGQRGTTGPLVTLLLLAAAILLVIQMRRPRASFDPLIGQPLPPLDAAGWLNSEQPHSAEDLRGKIVVLDFFASWCGPCAASLPELVKFHERYRGRGVMLVGLTDEPAADLDKIERFVHRVDGVDWPIGYGAWLAYQVTGIDAWPTYVLYDRTGASVWSGATVEELEEAVVGLLAKE